MSCGLRLALFVLYLSAASTTICNISECRPVVDGSLDTDDETVDLTEQFVVITANNDPPRDNCTIGITREDSEQYKLTLNIEISQTVSSISSGYSFYGHTFVGAHKSVPKDNGVVLQFNASAEYQTLAAKIWTSDYTEHLLNWNDELDKDEVPKISALIRGGDDITRTVDLTNCPDFTTYICRSCKEFEPNITELVDNNTTLSCSARSPFETEITWKKDGTTVDASGTDNVPLEDGIYTTVTSTLNITEDNLPVPANYTCTATNEHASTSKSITVLENGDEDGDHKDGGDADESKGEKSLLIYTIVGVVASLLVLGGTCFGLIKLATRCAEKKKRGGGRAPDTADPGTSATTTTDPSGGGDPPVIYAQVTPRKARRQEPDEDESIYNRLDPRLMTTRRDDFRTLNHAHFTASPSTDPLIQGCYEETLVIQMEELTGAGEEKNEGRRNEGRNAEVADLY